MSDKDKPSLHLETAADLNDLVFRDDLTQIYNRRFFYRYLKDDVPWGESEPAPVSLMMIDLDHFKQINDRHGHLEGDGALVHVSRLFQDRVGEAGHVIRYAGDEFAIILPDVDCDSAAQMAQEILDDLHESPFELDGSDKVLNLTLSIGVASYPADGSEPKKFIEAADRALYVAKRRGRDRVAVAGDINESDLDLQLQDLFPVKRTVGRDRELETFRGLLDAPTWSRNNVVLVRGRAGTGRTRFLHDVEAEGATRNLLSYFHSCEERDAEQPYYLFAHVLEGFGKHIPIGHRAQGLSEGEMAAVRYLLTDFFGARDEEPPNLPPANFIDDLVSGTKTFLSRVASDSPLVLLIDDIHHADSLSLEVLGLLLKDSVVPLVVGGALREASGANESRVRSTLGVQPHTTYDFLSFAETRLSALTPTEVGTFIRETLPGIRVDRSIVHGIWDHTKGNPLYTEEILKRFLQEDLLFQDDDGWQFREIDWEALPDSLEDAVGERIGGLDAETADLLGVASVLGARFRAETLAAVSHLGESRLLEMLDRGVAAGLIRRVRPFDDGEYEFLASTAKEVQEARIDAVDRAAIHGRIGEHEEAAHADELSSVYGRLQYHYGRSNNNEKAERYHDLAEHPDRLDEEVDGDAAIPAARRARARIREADTPLTMAEMGLMRNVLRFFSATLKNRMIYPPGSKIITESTQDLFGAMQAVFETSRVFTISNAKGEMLLNGVKVDPRKFVTGNREFLTLLQKYNIQSITITRDVQLSELEDFRDLLYLRTREDALDHEFWDRNLDDKGIQHLSVDQRLYVVAGSEAPKKEEAVDVSVNDSADGDDADAADAGDGELEGRLSAIIDDALSKDRDEDLRDIVREVIRLLAEGKPGEKRLGIQLFDEFLKRLSALKDHDRALAITEEMLDQLDHDMPERAFGPIARALGDSTCEFIKRGGYDIAVRMIRFLGHHERAGAEGHPVPRAARRTLQDIIRGPAFDLVIAELLSEDPRRQGEAREILLGFNALVVEPLIRVIRETDNYRTRKFTSLILNELGDGAVDVLKVELESDMPDDEYRRLLGVLDSFPDDFADQLSTALCHASPGVRSEASKLLRRIRCDIHRILLDVLRSGKEGGVITEAILQLGRLKSREAVAPILDCIVGDDVSESVLYEGCIALGRIGDARAVDFLINVLNGARGLLRRKLHSSKVRFAAAWSLAQIGNEVAREALHKVRRDRDTEIRALVTRSLK